LERGPAQVDNKKKNFQWLKEFSGKRGMVLFGVGDFTRYSRALNLSTKEIKGMNFAISLGIRLSKGTLASIKKGPTDLYIHHYNQANRELDSAAFFISDLIQKSGYRSLAIPASKTVNKERQEGHLSHKHIGVLAGHGWIGKNNLLVNRLFGSQVRYVTILTDFPLATGKPLDYNCGRCQYCVKACPAEALSNSPEEYNFKLCFQKLDSFYREKGLNAHICGICVKACDGGGF